MARHWHISVFLIGLIFIFIGLVFALSGAVFFNAHAPAFLWMAVFLVIDPLAFKLRGSSLIQRLGRGAILLLVVSIPFWLFFESLNAIFLLWKNYERASGGLAQIFYGISHASIIPSFFSLLYLLMPKLSAFEPARPLSLYWTWIWGLGSLCLFILLCLFPHMLYPILWVFLFVILDALNWRNQNLSILFAIKNLKVMPVLTLILTGVLLGIYWEGLNVIIGAEWAYHLPYFAKYRLFQMPLAGYLGYGAFACNIFAFSVWFLSLLPEAKNRLI